VAQNPFSRYAYAEYKSNQITTPSQYTLPEENLQVFAGCDLHAYINNTKVGNLESVTWTVSTEAVGNYVMGRRNPVAIVTGKRLIVGSMVFAQYDRHAILQQVFRLKERGIETVSQLWDADLSTQAVNNRIENTANAVKSLGSANKQGQSPRIEYTYNNMRGLTQEQYYTQLSDQVRYTSQLVGAYRVEHTDQLPPFNLTLVGVNKAGAAAKLTIFGMQITQETGGYSQNDMGTNVGVSYYAMNISHLEPLNEDTANSFYPGSLPS